MDALPWRRLPKTQAWPVQLAFQAQVGIAALELMTAPGGRPLIHRIIPARRLQKSGTSSFGLK
jgi:hypothetical protein